MKSKIETVLYTETINFKHFIRHNQAELDLYFIFYHKKRVGTMIFIIKITLSTDQFFKVTKFITNLMMYQMYF